MGTIGLVLALLAAVIVSGVVARAMPFNLPRPALRFGGQTEALTDPLQ